MTSTISRREFTRGQSSAGRSKADFRRRPRKRARATMQPFTEHNATDIVIASLAESRSERFRQIMTSVISHVHAIVREVEPTTAEWMTAIDFLTRTGQICDEKRQECILLSDVLGVSMLVDAVNHRKPSGRPTVLGPFHVPDAPGLPMGANISRGPDGEPVLVRRRSATRTEDRSVARLSMSGKRQPTDFTTFRTPVRHR